MDSKQGPPVGGLRQLTEKEWETYTKNFAASGNTEKERARLGVDDTGAVHVLPLGTTWDFKAEAGK